MCDDELSALVLCLSSAEMTAFVITQQPALQVMITEAEWLTAQLMKLC